MKSTIMQNPHLEGDSFLWEGGFTGALLIHGFTATTAEVRLLGKRLHEAGFTVSGPLLPGHGTTPQDMNRIRWQEWAKAADQALCDLESRCSRVWIGGESMGAVLALYLANQHPEVAGVLTYAPALYISPIAVLAARVLSPFVPMLKKREQKRTAADDHWKGYRANPLPAVVELNRLQRTVRPLLSRIHQPVLVIQGRLDEAIDPKSGQAIIDGVSSKVKELHWLEESTHCLILDREWEEAARITLAFMERNGS